MPVRRARRRSPSWSVTVASALIGAASDLGWEWLTHSDDWLRLVGVEDFYAATGLHWWSVSDLLSTVVGAAVVVGLAVRVGRRHEMVAQVRPPAPPARPALFRSVALVVAAAGVVPLPAARCPLRAWCGCCTWRPSRCSSGR